MIVVLLIHTGGKIRKAQLRHILLGRQAQLKAAANVEAEIQLRLDEVEVALLVDVAGLFDRGGLIEQGAL